MPLFEYLCKSCGQQVELLVRGGQQPICPECGAISLEKLLSVVAAPARSNDLNSTSCRTDLPPCGPGCCRLPD